MRTCRHSLAIFLAGEDATSAPGPFNLWPEALVAQVRPLLDYLDWRAAQGFRAAYGSVAAQGWAAAQGFAAVHGFVAAQGFAAPQGRPAMVATGATAG